MDPFAYQRIGDPDSAIMAIAREPGAAFIAGGTELLNWMKERIATPRRLLDINELPLDEVGVRDGVLRVGALARMSDVAAHPEVRLVAPAIARSLELSANPQLRNMASMGGNLLQRTRCPYFRADAVLACNKRTPGSGCAARDGENRTHAIFGWSEACVATHPSDVAVALAALDAVVQVRGPSGERVIPIGEFHRLPGDTPELETTLARDELITAIEVPLTPAAARSDYLKVRERASYEFALTSAAAGLEIEAGRIRDARIALGGVAHKPWRLTAAEHALRGADLTMKALREAVESAFGDARPLSQNGFKIELAKRTAVRALAMAGGVA
jgi:xanthine dehydrogenase YagS FAD-binding subunit